MHAPISLFFFVEGHGGVKTSRVINNLLWDSQVITTVLAVLISMCTCVFFYEIPMIHILYSSCSLTSSVQKIYKNLKECSLNYLAHTWLHKSLDELLKYENQFLHNAL